MDWRNIPSLAALKAFEAAARLKNFSAAARELNVTHAAIAQHVRALEDHFGQPLMERSGRSMAVTAAGGRLAQDLGEGFGVIAAGVRALSQARADRPIALSTTQNFAENWLVPRLAGFWKAHPDLPVTIAPDNAVVDLRRDGFDLAIRFGQGKWPGLEARLLTRAHRVVVAHPDVAARLPVEYSATSPNAIHALTGFAWLPEPTDMEMFTWLRALGADPDKMQVTRMQTNGLALAAVRSGAGITRQPLAVVQRDLDDGRLVALLEEPESDLGYYTVHNPETISPQARVFLKWLHSAT
ncbi:LysR family transcriptional regulator [Nioella aestuarii]|uniref:LysR family transcriptional regulator n=1 Tax=Nioella aestuarii TaxID=1662864 RepID=UPI003D7FCF79